MSIPLAVRTLAAIVLSCSLFSTTFAGQTPSTPKGTLNLTPPSVVAANSDQFDRKELFTKSFDKSVAQTTATGVVVGTSALNDFGFSKEQVCLNFGSGSAYRADADDRYIIGTVRLPKLDNPSGKILLTLDQAFELESDYDFADVRVLPAGSASWITAERFTGKALRHTAQVDLTSYAGQEISLSLRLVTDGSNEYRGWSIGSISVYSLMPVTFGAVMTSLNAQKFPFVYLNVGVARDGGDGSPLPQSSFAVTENGEPQTDYFEVLPPESGGGSRVADIVFVLDVTGSMSEELEQVKANMQSFVNSLAASGIDYGIGIICYSDWDYILNSGELYYNNATIISTIQNIYIGAYGLGNGGDEYEDGFDAAGDAVGLNFRPGSQRIFIQLTDAPSHEVPDPRTRFTRETIKALLEGQNVSYYPIFDTYDSRQINEYVPIATATGGKYYNKTSNFNEIINDIKQQMSNYRVKYYSSDPSFNGVERNVVVTVIDGLYSAQASGSYTPGEAPRIERTAPTITLHDQAWAEGTTLKIEVDVIDHVDPLTQGATLYYRTSGFPTFQTVAMAHGTGITWSASIPGSSVRQPGLDYYVTATDGVSTVSDPTSNPKDNAYQLAILPNEQPVISHTPPLHFTVGTNIAITADISDHTNTLSNAKLFYRKIGQLLYQEASMVHGAADSYAATIPSTYATSDGVEYYLKATDNFGVGSTHGTSDVPHHINPASPFASYLAEKEGLIRDIVGFERPFLGTDHPFYKEAEGDISSYLSTVHSSYDAGLATERELESIGRIALSERVAKQALSDATEISGYGAKGLRSLLVEWIIGKVVKLASKYAEKIPWIGHKLSKIIDSISGRIEKGLNDTAIAFQNSVLNSGSTPFLTPMQKQEIVSGGMGAMKDGLESGLEVTVDKLGGGLLETGDRIIQDIGFLGLYGLTTTGSQNTARDRCLGLEFPVGQFEVAQADVTSVYDNMVAVNAGVAAAENFANTTSEVLGWIAVFAGLVAAAIAFFGTGGLGAIAAIAVFAASLTSAAALLSSTAAITEAAVAFVHTEGVVPFLYVNPSVDKAFGPSTPMVTAQYASYQSLWSAGSGSASAAKPSQSTDVVNYFIHLRALLADGDPSWAALVQDSMNIVDQVAQLGEDLTIIDFRAASDSARSVISNWPSFTSSFLLKRAARHVLFSAIEIEAFAFREGEQTASVIDGARTALDSVISDLRQLEGLRRAGYDSLSVYGIPIPSTVGVPQIKYGVTGFSPWSTKVRFLVRNYGSIAANDIVVHPVFATQGWNFSPDSGVVSIGANDSLWVEFNASGGATVAVGYVLLHPSDSLAPYNTVSGNQFELDLDQSTKAFSEVAPTELLPWGHLTVKFTLGDFASARSVADVDLSSLRINGTISPTTKTISGAAGFTGPVIEATTTLLKLTLSYPSGRVLGTETYQVTGRFSDNTVFRSTGSVTFINILIGDVDGSAKVDGHDFQVLLAYLTGAGVQLANPQAADIDKNGVIDLRDLSLLEQMLGLDVSSHELR